MGDCFNFDFSISRNCFPDPGTEKNKIKLVMKRLFINDCAVFSIPIIPPSCFYFKASALNIVIITIRLPRW